MASVADALSQTSISSSLVRMTGMAFGWIGATTAFGSVVKNANTSVVTSPSLAFRTDVQLVHIPANTASGRLSSSANQTGVFLPSGPVSYSENDVTGTTQRFADPSQRRQCGEAVLRTLVTPGSVVLPLRANTGDGMPHRAVVSSLSPSASRIIGAG